MRETNFNSVEAKQITVTWKTVEELGVKVYQKGHS